MSCSTSRVPSADGKAEARDLGLDSGPLYEDALMTVVAMSHGELSRFDTLMRVERGEFRVGDAAALIA